MSTGDVATVAADAPLVVEHLARKLPEATTGSQFTISIWRRLRGDVIPTASRGGGGGGGDDDDDDDDVDDDDEDVVEEGDRPGAKLDRWALVDATFGLRRGEVLGVVGAGDTGAKTLMHVLDRRLLPDGGRAVIRGRAARTPFYNFLIAPSDVSVTKIVAALARAARVPRRSRRAWTEDVIRFGLYDEDGKLVPLDTQKVRRRVSIAAAIDASAELLLLDQMVWREDPDFSRRCADRLRAAVASGASALVSGEDIEPLLELCTRAVRFEDGVLVEEGPVGQLVEAEERRIAARRRRADRVGGMTPFNADAAIISAAAAVRRDGQLEVSLQVETAAPSTTLEPQISLRPVDRSPTLVVQHTEPFVREDPGACRITARVLVPNDLPEARVDCAVDVRVGAHGTRIGRRNIGVVGPTSDLPQQDGADVDLSAEPNERDVAAEWTFELE
jgi:ABC-type polysaccharide/polyol phosphate transport system ATPase subunit